MVKSRRYCSKAPSLLVQVQQAGQHRLSFIFIAPAALEALLLPLTRDLDENQGGASL